MFAFGLAVENRLYRRPQFATLEVRSLPRLWSHACACMAYVPRYVGARARSRPMRRIGATVSPYCLREHLHAPERPHSRSSGSTRLPRHECGPPGKRRSYVNPSSAHRCRQHDALYDMASPIPMCSNSGHGQATREGSAHRFRYRTARWPTEPAMRRSPASPILRLAPPGCAPTNHARAATRAAQRQCVEG